MHIPVLLQEILEYLSPEAGEVILDATIGSGCHAEKLCGKIGKGGVLIGIDMDKAAIDASVNRLKSCDACQYKVFRANYREMDELFKNNGIDGIDKALFDLGIGSMQLEDPKRGFSFRLEGPLDMNFSQGGDSSSAEHIVNTFTEDKLMNLLYTYGEERYAKKIAREIVKARLGRPIKTTTALVNVIGRAVPISYKKRRIHFATKTFQALRIEVNDELKNIQTGLPVAFKNLYQNGRIAVISYHSLEDRIVKSLFKDIEKHKTGRILTKKPVTPSDKEIMGNPRSRSAKLRVLEKI